MNFDNFKLAGQTYEKSETPISVPTTTDAPLINQTLPEIGIDPDSPEGTPVVKNETVEPTKQEPTEDKFSFLPILDYFGDKGLIQRLEGKTYEDSEAGFEQAITDTVESRWQEKLNSLNPTEKKLFGLSQEGLNPDKYANLIDYAEVDLQDLTNQRTLTYNYLIENDYTVEEAEAEVERYEEAGILDKQAVLAIRYLDKAQNDYVAYEQAKDRADLKAAQDKAQLEHDKIKNEILSIKRLGKGENSIELPEGEGQAIYDYIYKPVRNGKSQSQLDGENPETRLLLAYFMKNKFNIQSLLNSAETKVTRGIRDVLRNSPDKMAKSIDNGDPIPKKMSSENLSKFNLNFKAQ